MGTRENARAIQSRKRERTEWAGQAKGGGGAVSDEELERERAEVNDYVRRASAEFRRSMPERCFRHDHDFVNNRCKNCGFICIAEQAAGGSAAVKRE